MVTTCKAWYGPFTRTSTSRLVVYVFITLPNSISNSSSFGSGKRLTNMMYILCTIQPHAQLRLRWRSQYTPHIILYNEYSVHHAWLDHPDSETNMFLHGSGMYYIAGMYSGSMDPDSIVLNCIKFDLNSFRTSPTVCNRWTRGKLCAPFPVTRCSPRDIIMFDLFGHLIKANQHACVVTPTL